MGAIKPFSVVFEDRGHCFLGSTRFRAFVGSFGDGGFVLSLIKRPKTPTHAIKRNDSQVSAASGAILAPKTRQNVDDYWRKMEENGSNHSFVRVKDDSKEEDDESFSESSSDENQELKGKGKGKEKEFWYSRLHKEIRWKRVMVCLNQGWFFRRYSHTFLSTPVPSVKNCQCIFRNFGDAFVW